jgi:hypothetical protein
MSSQVVHASNLRIFNTLLLALNSLQEQVQEKRQPRRRWNRPARSAAVVPVRPLDEGTP